MTNANSLSIMLEEDHSAEELITKIGHLSRMLKGSMQELGLDREIEKAAESIPDANERLRYVAAMTEQAAHRALNSVDRAIPLVDGMKAAGEALNAALETIEKFPTDTQKVLAATSTIRSQVAIMMGNSSSIHHELMEILMAQDFQDLTGQVIKKMMGIINEIGHQLFELLADSSTEGYAEGVLIRLSKSEFGEEEVKELPGPQIKPTAGDAVSGQNQVDDLLSQLGV